jgi:hypothetical protein
MAEEEQLSLFGLEQFHPAMSFCPFLNRSAGTYRVRYGPV